MKRDYIDFQDRSQQLGYLITIRSYGTWLHGDARGSMDRRNYNKFGGPKRPVNRIWLPVILNLQRICPWSLVLPRES
jgi:hypothetical protein